MSRLKVGQSASLTDKNGRFDIGVLPPEFQPMTHTVIEVGGDFVALRDIGKITDSVVPIYSISSIRIMRIPNK